MKKQVILEENDITQFHVDSDTLEYIFEKIGMDTLDRDDYIFINSFIDKLRSL